MTLKATVDTLDGVDEKYHDLYEEKEGKFALKPIDGFKPLGEFNIVHTALGKERTEHGKTKKALTAFGDMKPDEVRAALDRIPELELAAEGKIDDNKIDKIVETRLRTKLTPLERERDQYKTQVAEKDAELGVFRQKDKARTIADVVNKEARGLKMLDTAFEDALLLAERQLEVGDDGSVLTKDGLDVKSWLTELQPKRPHWWPGSVGGGGRAGELGSFTENPWSAAHWNMTKQAQIEAGDEAKAKRMAAAAGSSLGAMSAPVKK